VELQRDYGGNGAIMKRFMVELQRNLSWNYKRIYGGITKEFVVELQRDLRELMIWCRLLW